MTKKFQITDKKAKNIVIGMAEHFGIDYEHDINEYCIRIPETEGSGYVKATIFDCGISVIEADYLIKQPFNFKLENDLINPLKLIFNRKSTFIHKFTGKKEAHEVKNLENMIASASPKFPHDFSIPANNPICLFSLEINRKKFENYIEDFLSDMNEDLIQLFRDVNGLNEFYHKSQFSLEISELISDFTDCDLEGFMRSVYLESKAKEILVLQLEQYLDDLNEPEKRKILRQATIESVKKAVDIIKTEIDSIDNVSKLAKRVGLSANSLQQGFRVLHKVSVNDFIKNYRIEKAKLLIETTALNITEITYQIGINSRSYFSKLFKEKYGINPSQYYAKVRSNKKDDTISA